MMHETINARNTGFHNARMHPKPDPRGVLRQLMKLKSIPSERQLAILAEIDQSAFNRYMNEDSQYLSTRNLQALAKCLEVTSSQILGEVALDADPKLAIVNRVMQDLPEHLKDVLVVTSQSLAASTGGTPKH